MSDTSMGSLHVKVESYIIDEIDRIMPCHGGRSHIARLALKNFIRDFKDGKLKATPKEGDPHEKS